MAATATQEKPAKTLPRYRVCIDDSAGTEAAKAARREQPTAVIEASSEGAAERKYKEAFGITGLEHPLLTEEVAADTPLSRLHPWTAKEIREANDLKD